MMHESLPSDVRIAIADATEAIVDEILHLLGEGRITDFETLQSHVDDSRAGEGGACDLDKDQQLDLLDCHGDELGIGTIDHISISDLRLKIEEASTAVLSSLARAEATDAFQDLERILDEEDVDLTSVSTTNALAWARHESESDHGSCHVYHYRNVEGNHLDVFEFELWGGRSVFLTRPVEADEVSPAEQPFEAS